MVNDKMFQWKSKWTSAATTTSTWCDSDSWASASAYDNQLTAMKCAFYAAGGRGKSELVEVMPNKLPAGARTLGLPDGANLIVDDLGNYRIDDADAKVVYKANRIRNFSPYLNASDLLAEFVKYAGTIGVRREDVLQLPIHLFVSWLVIEAAERDGDDLPEGVTPLEQDRLISLARKPQCLACGRFIKRLHYRHSFPYCSPEHAVRRMASIGHGKTAGKI